MKITTEDIQVGFHARQILKGISIESKDKELAQKCRNNAHCNGSVQYFQYVLQHFHGLSVFHGGVLADSMFRWYLYEAGRLNEYVLA